MIDYPVLYGVDNEKYLHTLYNKQYSAAGSIFLDAYNTKAFVDSTNVLYGHHMADRSMFASLDEWQHQLAKLERDEITQTEYDHWRYNLT